MTERGIATILIRGYGLYLMIRAGATLIWTIVGYISAQATGTPFRSTANVSLWESFGFTTIEVVVGFLLLLCSDGLIRFLSTPPRAKADNV